MRRHDREVTDLQEILAILDECKVIRLAMIDNGKPYVVPLNFGYACEGGAFIFYCHSALEGRKIDILHTAPTVAFELDCRGALQSGDTPCTHSYYYASILGEGTVEFLSGEAKLTGFSALMRHMAGRNDRVFPEEMVEKTAVFAIHVSSLSAKKRAPKA